ncbi:MAG: DUF192 domain-containing protein [Terracidiphilus sp.]
MELQRLCAYNQTRECFLGLEVAAADVSFAALKDLLGRLTLKSGEGLWISPFRGIPDTNMRIPLDLIYLDEDCRAIEIVESFPTFHATTSIPNAASVLALPTHSIYSSQTQAGDQLVLCAAEEMQHSLERFSSTSSTISSVQSAVLLRGKPLWSGGPGVVELEDRSADAHPEDEVAGKDSPKTKRSKTAKIYEMSLAEPGVENVRPPKSWLERWWSPDPRKAPERRKSTRTSSSGLAAYYWTGAAPTAHNVKDFSSNSLYVVTEERWYPGTLILMTLQKTSDGEANVEKSISVHCRAVRWGNDGVGLQFVPIDDSAARKGLNELVNGANRKDLEQFLEQLRKTFE